MLSSSPGLALEQFRVVAPGATQEVARALEAASLLVTAYRDGITDPVELMAAARADYARFVGALYSEGYYGGQVRILVDGREAVDISPLAPPSRIDSIVVQVVPGPLYRFERAEIGPLARRTELPEGYRRGEPAKSDLIRQAVDASVSAWRDAGNAKADLAGQRIVADHAADTLDAQVQIAPGPRLRFGRLEIEGTSRVSDRRIRQIAGLPTGEVFSPDDLNRTGRRLRQTGVFRSVALREADQPNPDGTLDITALVEDRKPRRFGFGAEYATDEGVTLSAFWLHRNLLGEALRFRIGGEVSGLAGQSGGEDYQLRFDLNRPATFGSKTDAFFTGELESLNEEEFEADTIRLTFGATRRQTDELTLQAAIRFLYSDEVDDTGESEFSQIYFPFRATYDRRDSELDTIDGYYAAAEIAPFVGLDDSESGARLELDARWYEDFGAGSRFVFAARLQMGAIFGASVTGVPNDLRFYSGGGGSVRGQEYQSLGITLPGGADSGGRSFLGLQSELRARITDTISVVGFYDWGQVSADSTPWGEAESHSGAGIGVRYNTGIGPIRLDVGFPVSGEQDGDDFQLYIGVGQAF